ncbi:Epididymis-specific alpha-mannosidase-like protein [Reticulomyxa filosa]|uniref:Epididymis-specific alpha-mannosidase-like protein n=1 Tax=Reticulomyxa filosa TaxID=46433 RepID=X6NUL9_RETFI|nr:Epididymis-specific alpha-mannosidase-like protein [Reticulomyxa filosa]|eukprot:ETO29479.1 Epididymis-specific alpha-mannosidase-like protein [Reticulomyxa filosa]
MNTMDTKELFVNGKVTVTVPAHTNKVVKVNFTFDNANDFVVNEPVVLYSLQQVSPRLNTTTKVYNVATTSVFNGKKGFGLNIYPVSSFATSVTYQVTYLAFERTILYQHVHPPVDVTFVEGPLVSEAQQVWQANYSQTYRVFNVDIDDLKYVDVSFVQVHLGPIDQGAEFITRWSTSLDSNGLMYTCQNALEYVERTYQPNLDERIGANYYPTASQAYLCDSTDKYRFATIVNQAHGVSSLVNGEIELMLHRRCLSDDHKGVDEVLNETTHIEPRIFVVYDVSEQVSYSSRRLFQRQHYGATKFYALSPSISDWTNQYGLNWTAIGGNYSSGLPNNIHLQDLRYAYSGLGASKGLILQLQHMFETDENLQWLRKTTALGSNKHMSINKNCQNRSVDETIDIEQLFDPAVLLVEEVTEMTLTANLPLSNLKKLQWIIVDENGQTKPVGKAPTPSNGTVVTLSPRQIRTFVVN